MLKFNIKKHMIIWLSISLFVFNLYATIKLSWEFYPSWFLLYSFLAFLLAIRDDVDIRLVFGSIFIGFFLIGTFWISSNMATERLIARPINKIEVSRNILDHDGVKCVNSKIFIDKQTTRIFSVYLSSMKRTSEGRKQTGELRLKVWYGQDVATYYASVSTAHESEAFLGKHYILGETSYTSAKPAFGSFLTWASGDTSAPFPEDVKNVLEHEEETGTPIYKAFSLSLTIIFCIYALWLLTSPAIKRDRQKQKAQEHLLSEAPVVVKEQERQDETPPAKPFKIDEGRLVITYFDQPLELSRYEFRLLKVFIEKPGRVYSRDQLKDLVWDEPEASLERTVDAHVSMIRAKLKEIRPDISPIRTHRGIGYSMIEDWEELVEEDEEELVEG